MRPIGIDLFSGAGGLSLGFEQAGFDIAAAVDIDPVHCAVHHFNFPGSVAVPRSVDNLSASEIRDAASIGDLDVDCVFGGAPCQGFSMIGHRALDDPRNGLVRHFVRLVAELKARCFVFENVKGLTVGKHRSFLRELVAEFEGAGYAVRLPWRVLNAANYGTPQSRERLIVLGARAGEVIPGYPEPTTGIAGRQRSLVGLPDGNAVPPPLARAVAAEVIKSLGMAQTRPNGAIGLGDPDLLNLGGSGAAAHFGVDPLPSRRDRKSGATKRRQIDIETERLAAASFHG